MQHDLTPSLHIEASWEGVVVTVTVVGDLDAGTAPGLTGRLMQIAADRPERLVLDLHWATFHDLAGAQAIATVRKAIEGECPVIVRRIRPAARNILARTGVIPAE